MWNLSKAVSERLRPSIREFWHRRHYKPCERQTEGTGKGKTSVSSDLHSGLREKTWCDLSRILVNEIKVGSSDVRESPPPPHPPRNRAGEVPQLSRQTPLRENAPKAFSSGLLIISYNKTSWPVISLCTVGGIGRLSRGESYNPNWRRLLKSHLYVCLKRFLHFTKLWTLHWQDAEGNPAYGI